MEEVRQFPAPVLDRATVERLFSVRRRRANQIMARMGGYQVGRTGLVDREHFLAGLESIASGEEFHYEERRRTRVHEKLDEARRIVRAQRVKIPVSPAAPPGPALPQGVTLHGKEIRIAFDTPETLLTRLFELSQTIANDYDEFVTTLSKTT
jgi:hypothetical protein